LAFIYAFNWAKNKLKFVLEKQEELKKNKDFSDFVLKFVFSNSMREFLKNEELCFENTLFSKLYEQNKNSEAKVDFKGALGESLNDQVMRGLKNRFVAKKREGQTNFYFDKDAVKSLLKDFNRSSTLNKLRDVSFVKNRNKNMLPDVKIVCQEY